ncbi:uncharacterized protein LOC126228180 [Schistocerca nitens]|uniref:uncharacterized protein LOC126228180 n=1 Tax=Schistocerca nitens TaxID=7011 RepID=UPI0021179122|nr:uncharacterized protein LOC126228180 [Schistocerca nitens]
MDFHIVTRSRNGAWVQVLADDLTLLSNSMEEFTSQIQGLYSIAAKTGLRVNIQKAEFIANIKQASSTIPLGNDTMCRVPAAKYLGEWISASESETLTTDARCTKLERAYHSYKNICTSNYLSTDIKLNHYKLVVKPSALYASGCLLINRKAQLRTLELKERKILRRILGLIREEDDIHRIRHNNELCEHQEDIVTCMRERRLTFHGHMTSLRHSRLTNRILAVLSMGKASNAKWITRVKSDLEGLQIPLKTTENRTQYGQAILQGVFRLSLTSKKCTGTTRPKTTDERKQAHRQKMKAYWANKNQKTLAES